MVHCLSDCRFCELSILIEMLPHISSLTTPLFHVACFPYLHYLFLMSCGSLWAVTLHTRFCPRKMYTTWLPECSCGLRLLRGSFSLIELQLIRCPCIAVGQDHTEVSWTCYAQCTVSPFGNIWRLSNYYTTYSGNIQLLVTTKLLDLSFRI